MYHHLAIPVRELESGIVLKAVPLHGQHATGRAGECPIRRNGYFFSECKEGRSLWCVCDSTWRLNMVIEFFTGYRCPYLCIYSWEYGSKPEDIFLSGCCCLSVRLDLSKDIAVLIQPHHGWLSPILVDLSIHFGKYGHVGIFRGIYLLPIVQYCQWVFVEFIACIWDEMREYRFPLVVL